MSLSYIRTLMSENMITGGIFYIHFLESCMPLTNLAANDEKLIVIFVTCIFCAAVQTFYGVGTMISVSSIKLSTWWQHLKTCYLT